MIIAIADNAEAKREAFCKDVSEKYGISVPLLEKIIDRCPIILKKNLSLKKAEALAKVLRSFGAVVSVQEKRDLPAISLEFQELSPHRLVLESSSLLRTQSGSWNVIGRAKNISQESLSDTWVLIELFSDLDEFLAFEEVPIPINPLPPGKASPFKAVFEGDLPVKKVSIMFKDSSGYALSTAGRRKKREWVEEVSLPQLKHGPGNLQDFFQEAPLESAKFDEAPQLLVEIPFPTRERESFPWIEDFRNSVENYYQEPRDIFSIWFKGHRRENGFSGPLDSLSAILVHARFDQMSQSEKALENTKWVFRLIVQPNLQLEEIPPLWGTEFYSGEQWRELFHRAVFRIRQVANNIIGVGGKRWNTLDLERLIQVIPYMSGKNSRKAVRWMNELIPDIVEIDFSNTPVFIDESLYRVVSRLGVVNPYFDRYRRKDSMGDLKIQSFAKAAFPQNPMKIEEPMSSVGMEEEEGGHCLPTQPRCATCIFETFCPKLCLHFNPSEKGMRE